MCALFALLPRTNLANWQLPIQFKSDPTVGIRLLHACRFQGNWLPKESNTTSLWQAQGPVQVLLLVVIQMKGTYMICSQVCPVTHVLFHLYVGKIW